MYTLLSIKILNAPPPQKNKVNVINYIVIIYSNECKTYLSLEKTPERCVDFFDSENIDRKK